MVITDRRDGYGIVSRLFHWLMAVAIFAMFGLGYWMVRAGGQVYAFGNALSFAPYSAPACDPVVAIISKANGCRVVVCTRRPPSAL